MRRLYLALIAVLLLAPVFAFAQYDETGWPVVDIGSPAPSKTEITSNQTWLAGHVYHIQGFVYIDSGYTLTIQPGTIVKGDPGQAANATALIISPGAKIIAKGSPKLPIIFTTMLDKVGDTSDIPDVASSRGLWGGLILEGRAFTCAAGGESIMEGVPDYGRISRYGGGLNPDCHDNSGILEYVSLRYAGSILAPNVEINCLSLGAIGDGTTLDHIETFYGADDDIEAWGGSVNLLYTAIIYGDDDGWDTDECWSGMKQFGFMLKDPRWGDRETENDGRQQAAWTDTTSMASTEVPSGWGCNYPSYALNANLTCIGQGSVFSGTEGNRTLMRENYRAYWYNNVFMAQPKAALEIDCPGGNPNIDVQPSSTRNLPSGAASLAAGHPLLDLAGNFWWRSYATGSGLSHFTSTGTDAISRVQNDLFPGGDTTITGKNHLIDPQLMSYEVVNPPIRHGAINPVPKPSSPLIGNAKTVPAYAQPNSAYTPTTYAGAFDPNIPLNESWIWGWTVISDCYDILGTNPGTCCLLAGDANNNSIVNALDITFIINFLYKHGAVPPCRSQADANGNGTINALDVTYLINFLYKHGAAPICGHID